MHTKHWTDNRLGILMHTNIGLTIDWGINAYKHWTDNKPRILMHTNFGLTIDWGY